MTTQSYLFNQADDLKSAITEEDWLQADLERLRERKQDPYRKRQAAAAHARDIDMVRNQARNNGEGWAK